MKTYPEIIAEGIKRTIFQEDLLTEAKRKMSFKINNDQIALFVCKPYIMMGFERQGEDGVQNEQIFPVKSANPKAEIIKHMNSEYGRAFRKGAPMRVYTGVFWSAIDNPTERQVYHADVDLFSEDGFCCWGYIDTDEKYAEDFKFEKEDRGLSKKIKQAATNVKFFTPANLSKFATAFKAAYVKDPLFDNYGFAENYLKKNKIAALGSEFDMRVVFDPNKDFEFSVNMDDSGLDDMDEFEDMLDDTFYETFR